MGDLANIRRRIEGISEDDRFDAWMEWYSSPEPDLRREMDKLVELKDPVLKLLWARFLGYVPEERAVAYLKNLLKDLNPVVVEATKRAFDKNQFERKAGILLELVKHRNQVARDFAIERLYQAAHPSLIDPLLELLPKSDEKLLSLILTAFRYLPDPRTLPHLLFFLKDSREMIRQRTALALSSLYEMGLNSLQKNFVAHLNDPAPEVRTAIVWSLRRRVFKGNRPVFLRLAFEDPEAAVRQEALLGLASFPTAEVIHHLLSLIVAEKNRQVLLRAESVLIGMPIENVVRGLRAALRKGSKEIRDKAMFLLAHLQKGSEKIFRELTAGLQRAKDDREKFPFIEALGILGDPRGISVLDVYLKGSPFLAYAAMGALIRLTRHGFEPALVPYLREPSLSALLKQAILKDLVRRGNLISFTEELIGALTEFLKSDNINIRYLSAHVLVLARREESLGPLVEMLLKEKDPTTLKFLEESLIRSLSADPRSYLRLLEQFQETEGAIPLLLSLMKGILLGREEVVFLIASLLSSPMHLQEGPCAPMLGELLISWIIRNRVPLERISVETLPFLVKFFKKNPEPDLVPPAVWMTKWFEKGSEELKNALLDLVCFSGEAQAARLPAAVLCREALKRHHAKAVRAIATLVWGETP